MNLSTAALIVLTGMFAVQTPHAQSQEAQQPLDQSTSSDSLTLNLENVDIRTLIETVAQRLDKIFIIDPRVKATVTVISTESTDKEDLYELFLSVLDVHGFTAVEAGSITKIVPTTTGVQSPVPVLNEQAATDNELVTEVVPVRNVPTQQLVEVLRPLLSPSASISAEASSNTLIITDNAANITRLKDIIRELENPN